MIADDFKAIRKDLEKIHKDKYPLRDPETFVLHPVTGDTWVIAKTTGRVTRVIKERE